MCICQSVCLTPLQSGITFDPLDGSRPNFQGHPNSSQNFLGRQLDPRVREVRQGPKSAFSSQTISSQGFETGGPCYTFLATGGQGKNNVRSGILILGPWPKIWDEKARLAKTGGVSLVKECIFHVFNKNALLLKKLLASFVSLIENFHHNFSSLKTMKNVCLILS